MPETPAGSGKEARMWVFGEEDPIGMVVAGDVDDVQLLRLVRMLEERGGVLVSDQPVVLHVDETERRVHVAHVFERAQFRTSLEVPVETRRVQRLRQRDVPV